MFHSESQSRILEVEPGEGKESGWSVHNNNNNTRIKL